MDFNKNRMGLSLGSLFALMHFLWVLVVFFGWAEALSKNVLTAHFFKGETVVVADFSFTLAVLGVLGAFLCGYIIGWVFAWLWNGFGKCKVTKRLTQDSNDNEKNY